MSIKLRPCPFCGGEASIRKGNIYLDITYRVQCNECNAMTYRFFVDHPQVKEDGTVNESTRYTEEQAMRKAAEAWNTRISDAQSLKQLCDIVCKTNYGDTEVAHE